MPAPLSFQRVGQYGYDLGRYPEPIFLDFNLDSSSTSTPIAFPVTSSTGIVQRWMPIPSSSLTPMEDLPSFVSNDTNLTLLHAGDDVELSAARSYFTPVDAIVDGIFTNIAVGLTLSAASAGNFSINTIRVLVEVFKRGLSEATTPPMDRTTTGGAATIITAAGATSYVVLNAAKRDPFVLYAGGLMRIQVIGTVSTGTGTFQNGILPVFPYQVSGGLRNYYKSCVKMYVRPMLTENGSLTAVTDLTKFAGGAR